MDEQEFSLFTIDTNRRLSPAPMQPCHFKDMNYQGRIIIKINDNVAVDADIQPEPDIVIEETASIDRLEQPLQRRGEPMQPPVQQNRQLHQPVHADTRTSVKATQTMESSFREEVTINPRHALLLQQDLEYAESLAIDQNREHQRLQASLRRSMARTERQRQRNLQKERQEKIQADAIEEISHLRNYGNQDDLITMIFVLQTGQQNRRISKKTPSDDSESEEDEDDNTKDDTLPYNPTHLNGNLLMPFRESAIK
ncbi:hypothetical protein KUTeg_014637 [Tegillarca granosa]|uniref:Uncharacterized protein n=1 Tax=Tegillarca granosa TaxID=220873 RepID=A0ABQ9ERF3_TEGGR|nr:hypothetical protein KUTeg_014637 [Tegillarca granosa]